MSSGAPIVLIVEDDKSTQFILKNVLENVGFNVVCESDGREAMSSIIRAKPDLVLLDLNLPTLNGDKLLRVIRNNPSYPWMRKLPVVILSANKNPKVIKAMASMECSGYMIKPVVPDKILATVEKILDGELPSGRARESNNSQLIYKHIYCMDNPGYNEIFLSILSDKLMLYSHMINFEKAPAGSAEGETEETEDKPEEAAAKEGETQESEAKEGEEEEDKTEAKEESEQKDKDEDLGKEEDWEKVPCGLNDKNEILSQLSEQIDAETIIGKIKTQIGLKARPSPLDVITETDKIVSEELETIVKQDDFMKNLQLMKPVES